MRGSSLVKIKCCHGILYLRITVQCLHSYLRNYEFLSFPDLLVFGEKAKPKHSNPLLITFQMFIIIIIQTGQFAGDPIDCWTPSEFNGQWVRYTDRLCWVQNTYYVPFDQSLPGMYNRSLAAIWNLFVLY